MAFAAVAAALCAEPAAAQFAVFPKTGELASPDGKYILRNREHQASQSEFAGTFHSLWLVETATRRWQKLRDYLGLTAVMWSGNDMLIMTEYARTTSRVFVFSAEDTFSLNKTHDPVVLDKSALVQRLSPDLRDTVRENDHIFIEAAKLEDDVLHLQVWGRGQRDPGGFRWHCTYALSTGALSCSEKATVVQEKSGLSSGP